MRRTRVAGWLILLAVVTLASDASGPLGAIDAAAGRSTAARTGLDDPRAEVAVTAAGRGAPWINLMDGRAVPTRYVGADAAQAALLDGSSRATAMTSADFDEDGVPDLLAAYVGAAGGTLVLHRGNVDAIYPHTPEARARHARGGFSDAPFLPDADVILLPVAARFLGAGDFDADGHWDAVVASADEPALHLLPGDGRGGFAEPVRMPLPGTVSALVTGEVNRRDGLSDLVLGVETPRGAKVLVFEGPEGALRGDPELFSASARVTSLALERLGSEPAVDLAVAAGNRVMVLHGRDRKLSLDVEQRASVKQAVLDRIRLPFTVASIVTGDFDGDLEPDLAIQSEGGVLYHGAARRLLAAARAGANPMDLMETARLPGAGARPRVRAKVSATPGDGLILSDQVGRRLDLLLPAASTAPDAAMRQVDFAVAGEPVAVLPMRLNGDSLDDIVVLLDGTGVPVVVPSGPASTFTVTSTADPGDGICNAVCTLREAINAANANPGSDTITFGIAGAGPHTIQVLDYLPDVTQPVFLDATTQPGYPGTPWVRLDGASIPVGIPAGGRAGLVIAGGSSTVRGLAVTRFRNDGTDIEYGIKIVGLGGNRVEGCFVGIGVDGSTPAGNGFGIFAQTADNIIGGTTAAARNVASDNAIGIAVYGPGTTNTRVQGNIVGLDATGAAALDSNSRFAIILAFGTTGVQIGGTTAGSRNVAACKTEVGPPCVGVGMEESSGNLVQGNYIGTDITGALAAGNESDGVDLFGAAIGNTIGGTTPAARNVISANGDYGVYIEDPAATANLIQGNYIGTTASGLVALGNGADPMTVEREGLYIFKASGNTIGGSVTGAGNVISGNVGGGIVETSTTGNVIAGNLIGTDRTGAAPLPNYFGVLMDLGTIDSVLGGTSAGARNVISSNTTYGVMLLNDNTARVRVSRNRIGTDVSGTLAMGNGWDGVRVVDATGNLIGGPAVSDGNLIRHNAGAGVLIDGNSATGNSVRFNSISDNGALGIDLAPLGVTPNDPDDSDTGPNVLQNYPVLSSTSASGVDVDVAGSFRSVPATNFTLDFYASDTCDASGHGEGRTHVGTIAATTSGAGRAAFSERFTASVSSGQAITATATGPSGSTSEFSACFAAAFRPAGLAALTGIRFPDPGGRRLDWDPANGAGRYAIYRGTRLDLPSLLTGDVDSCRRVTVEQPSSGDLLTEVPGVGQMFWYLVTGVNESGDGSAGTALPGGQQGPVERQLDSAGICVSAECPHDRCATGQALSPVCDACVDTICTVDPACCEGANGFWGPNCVKEVRTVCLNMGCPDSQGTCSHPICKTGTALSPGCDPPAGNLNSCVAAVCNVDSFCCDGQTGSWDETCVGEVASLCGLGCD